MSQFLPYYSKASSIQVLKGCSYSLQDTKNKNPTYLHNFLSHTLAQETHSLYLSFLKMSLVSESTTQLKVYFSSSHSSLGYFLLIFLLLFNKFQISTSYPAPTSFTVPHSTSTLTLQSTKRAGYPALWDVQGPPTSIPP